MSLRLQPVRVGTGSDDEDGRLVFRDDALVALLVRLSDNHEGTLASGSWRPNSAAIAGIRQPSSMTLNKRRRGFRGGSGRGAPKGTPRPLGLRRGANQFRMGSDAAHPSRSRKVRRT